jgi:hypothetical protein
MIRRQWRLHLWLWHLQKRRVRFPERDFGVHIPRTIDDEWIVVRQRLVCGLQFPCVGVVADHRAQLTDRLQFFQIALTLGRVAVLFAEELDLLSENRLPVF